MSDSPLRIIMIAILLIAVFAFILFFLYLGMQSIVEQQKVASAESSRLADETPADMSSALDTATESKIISENDSTMSDSQYIEQSDSDSQNLFSVDSSQQVVPDES